jgi:hypothetical protein
MDQFLLHALNGSQDANRVIARLGLSLRDLNQANQGERMMLFADALNRVADSGERVALQREIFGRGWAAMNIEGGRAGIEQRAARTRYLQGDSMHSTEALQAARAYGEAKREFGQAMEGVWASLGQAAAPVMTDFLQMITRVVVGVREWIDANRPLLTTTRETHPPVRLSRTGVRNTLGIGTLERATAPQLEQITDRGQQYRDRAAAERRSTQEQIAEIEREAMDEWIAEQERRAERDRALAEGNAERVAELNAELEALTAHAEFLRDSREALAGAGDAAGRGPGMTGTPTTHVAGAFSAEVIAGFIGASMGAGETRGERETRMARERLDEILRELERRPGVVMG